MCSGARSRSANGAMARRHSPASSSSTPSSSGLSDWTVRPGPPTPPPGDAGPRRSPRAPAADRDRRIAGDVVSAITEAGFARHFAPREFGGAEGTFTDYLHGTAVLAQGCASAAWCASVFASQSRAAAYLPEEAKQEIWA